MERTSRFVIGCCVIDATKAGEVMVNTLATITTYSVESCTRRFLRRHSRIFLLAESNTKYEVVLQHLRLLSLPRPLLPPNGVPKKKTTATSVWDTPPPLNCRLPPHGDEKKTASQKKYKVLTKDTLTSNSSPAPMPRWYLSAQSS